MLLNLYTNFHWVALNMELLLEEELQIWKLYHGNKKKQFFTTISEYIIKKKLLYLLYFHYS